MDGIPASEDLSLTSDQASTSEPAPLGEAPPAGPTPPGEAYDTTPGPLAQGSEVPKAPRARRRATAVRRMASAPVVPVPVAQSLVAQSPVLPPPVSSAPSTAVRRPPRVPEPPAQPAHVAPGAHSQAALPGSAAQAAIPPGPTLAIDIGGTGLKASVLDQDDKMETARVRVPTTYPIPPARMVSTLAALVAPLPPYERVSVGFPGVVRSGKVVTAPHFVTRHGPGTKRDKALIRAWTGFDLARALSQALGKPVRVANDADLQGAAVIEGKGLELVVTLGTGVGTGLFWQGHLAPHLELAQHPLARGETYNGLLGEAARKKVGNKIWRKRVLKAIDTLDTLINYDHLYIGGGNSGRLAGHVGQDVTIVDNDAGILGGIKLWEGNIV